MLNAWAEHFSVKSSLLLSISKTFSIWPRFSCFIEECFQYLRFVRRFVFFLVFSWFSEMFSWCWVGGPLHWQNNRNVSKFLVNSSNHCNYCVSWYYIEYIYTLLYTKHILHRGVEKKTQNHITKPSNLRSEIQAVKLFGRSEVFKEWELVTNFSQSFK